MGRARDGAASATPSPREPGLGNGHGGAAAVRSPATPEEAKEDSRPPTAPCRSPWHPEAVQPVPELPDRQPVFTTPELFMWNQSAPTPAPVFS